MFNDQRIALLSSSIQKDDRILITGATGWFGQTALHLLIPITSNFFLTSSTDRTLSIQNQSFQTHNWSFERVKRFEPTIVLDFAYLTRNKIQEYGIREYERINSLLTERAIRSFQLDSVRSFLSVSSGASIHTFEQNQYGEMKQIAERKVQNSSYNSLTKGAIIRPWSVSGPFVMNPYGYALSDFILNCFSGEITINAGNKVFRRYTSVADLITVGLLLKKEDEVPIIDSGGDLIEIQQLAEVVRTIVNPQATIIRNNHNLQIDEDHYYSDGGKWLEVCKQTNYRPLNLKDQIIEASQGLLSNLAF